MKKSLIHKIYLALIHYPVVNKNGEIITSAITNLDLHDIARASKTFGVKKFYVVTPLNDQKEIAEKLISHWINGHGSINNPIRKQALELIRLLDTVDQVIHDIKLKEGNFPKTVVTHASIHPQNINFDEIKIIINKNSPILFLFGTAWGLSKDLIESCDYILEPIRGNSEYNHLSVRSAVSIILDRLLGMH